MPTAIAVLGAGAGLMGCSVCAPIQPTTSNIRHAGQVELTAGLQASGRLEGGALYSPLPHVLLAAGGSYKPQLGTPPDYVFRTRQWEAGAGGYLPLGQRWLLTGLLGYGQANTARSTGRGSDSGVAGYSLTACETQYRKAFAQAGLSFITPRISYNWTVRYAQLNFDYLNAQRYDTGEVLPVALGRTQQLAYVFCIRTRLGAQPSNWQFQATGGLAGTMPKVDFDSYEDRFSGGNETQKPLLLLSGGVVFTPGMRLKSE